MIPLWVVAISVCVTGAVGFLFGLWSMGGHDGGAA